MAFDPSTAQLDSTFDPDTATESPDPGFKAGDYLKGLKRGVLAVPGTLTGLADIPIALATGERVAGPVADALGRVTGFQPSKWAKETGETFSPGAKAAQAKIEEAWKGSGADRLGNALLGNFGDLPAAWKEADLAGAGRAIVENPGASALQVVESLPAMLAGGAIGKGVAVASKLAPAIAGAIGEGAITAGQQMDQTDAAVDPRRAAATSATAGALTGAIAGGMGRVAQKLGLEDIQTTMAGGKADATGLGRAGRLAGGAASEALQEIPQSAQEQVWQNVADEKPLGEGVVRSAVEGGIAGGVMGAGANLRRPGTPLPPPGATAPGDIAEMDTLNAGLAQAGNDYAGQLPPNAGLLEEKPLVVQNPTTGVVTEIDRRGGPLEQAAAIAVESGAHEVAQNVDASEILFPYANARAAQDYIGRQADPEMYDAVPHPRVEGRTAVVPKTGPARQAILDKRAAGAANEQAKLRGEQLKQDESPAPTEITESISGAFGNGSTGNVTITPQRGGGFEIRVSSSDGATKRSSVAGFPAGTDRTKAIAAATRSHGGFTKDKPVVKAKPVVDTTVADAAQDELAPPTVQPVTDMPGVQQRAKVRAQGAVATAQTRAAQLADEENIDSQAQAANPEPSEAQRTAGNYAHGHIRVGGLDISVETPAGAARTGTDKGKTWKVKNTAHYGYVKRTQGADGEQVDVYVKPGTSSTSGGPVFVVDQYNPATGAFDEHKALLGYSNQAEAASAYDAHFNDKSGPKRRGAVTQMSLDAFKGWLANGDTSKAVSGKRFGKVVADNEQAAQDEIARSTGKLSLPRSAQKPGESDAAFELRRAAATQATKTARAAGQQALPTKDGDKAGVREALGMPDDAEVSILSAESRPDAGKAKGVSKQAAQFIQQVARTFGKRVVFFDVPDRGAAEGFYVRGNTIYLNTNSATQHLRVLGHEMTHAMKRQARDSYEKMLGAVATLRTDEEMAAQYADYFGRPLDDVALLDQPHPGSDGTLREFLAEEWMADLGGNRFAEAEFWTSVFGRLEGQHGTDAAKGIVAKLRLALVAALNKLKTLIGDNAFAVDARLGEHLEGIRTAVAEGFAEYARLSKAGQLAEVSGEAKFAPAWHGTPHVWEPEPGFPHGRPRLDKMGTGEGAQAYGWGWYSAEAQGVAEGYRTAPGAAFAVDGKTYAQLQNGWGDLPQHERRALTALADSSGDAEEALFNLDAQTTPESKAAALLLRKWIDEGRISASKGTLYHLDIPDEVMSHLLDWDKPLSEQPAYVLNLVRDVAEDAGLPVQYRLKRYWPDKTGQDLYGALTAMFASSVEGKRVAADAQKSASVFLASWGIPGLRYLDGNTRNGPPLTISTVKGFGGKTRWEVKGLHFPAEFNTRAAAEKFVAQQEAASPPTSNFVIWDQPTLDKVALLKRNGEALDAIRAAFSPRRRAEATQTAFVEAVPSEHTRAGKAVGALDTAQKTGFTEHVFDKVDPAKVAQAMLGRQDVRIDVLDSTGGYQPEGAATGKISPNVLVQVTPTGERPVTLDEAVRVAQALNYVYTQDGVPVSRYDEALLDTAEGTSVVRFTLTALKEGHTVSAQEEAFYRQLEKVYGVGIGYSKIDGKIVVGNYGGLDRDEFLRLAGQVAAEAGVEVEQTAAEGDYVFHDWKNDAQGTGHEVWNSGDTAGRPDLQARLHDWRDGAVQAATGWLDERGIKYSPGRRHVGPESSGEDSGSSGPGPGEAFRLEQKGRVDLTGVHFSKEPRSFLSGIYFGKGSGAASQEAERVRNATDERIKSRIYAYVNEGKGVFPEDDVGRHAHSVKFDNLYDAKADPLDLGVKYRDANSFESAILDAGFDGYYSRAAFGNQGVAILMGKAAARGSTPEYKGTEYRGEELEVPPIGEPSTFGKQLRAVAANRGLPSGEMTGADWKRLMPKLMPDIDVSHLNDEQKYYKDEIIKRPQALAKKSTQRLAPNGRLSNLDERQWHQVRTPEFKAWFGDWEAAHNGKDGNGVWARDDVSKVVDENGEPLVVYHGTERGGFTTFRPDKADRQRSPMIFAAATRETARTYAGRGTEIDLDSIEEPLAGYHVVKTEVENYPWKVVDQYGSDVDAYQRFQSEAMAQKWLDVEREDAEPGAQVGVYSLFLNLRNPNEADFEGANWDGAAPYDMYEVIDDNEESFYSSQGERFMDIVTARIVVERHGLPDDAIRPAQDLLETTNTVAEDAKRYGNDGAIIRRTLDDGGNSGRPADVDDVFVVFGANQLKSAVGNTGTFSPKNDDIRYSPPRFFSQLARTFENAPAKLQTQPAAQWKLWLAGQQAVKRDEIAWSGINDWLDLQGKAKVSRAQIQEYLAHNGVQLGEKLLGDKGREEALLDQIADLENDIDTLRENYPDDNIEEGEDQDDLIAAHEDIIADKEGELSQLLAQLDTLRGETEAKFDAYQLPGGQNYKELLITLPRIVPVPEAEAAQKRLDASGLDEAFWAGAQQQIDNMRNAEYARREFRSAHFDEPNILAHVRFNERVDTDGHKVLFLEELQSDWGQQGKRKGFIKRYRPEDIVAIPEDSPEAVLPHFWYFRVPGNVLQIPMTKYPNQEDARKYVATKSASGVVEPGPFVTDTKAWTALALKRAVLWAVQHGFSKVAWTTGKQQAERYDLSKHVGYISLDRGYPDGYIVTAYRNDDATDEILQKDVKTPEELADVIGKDAANKLIKDIGKGTHSELSRPDIKVGGEGMVAYYDSIVPQVANDLLRKVGGGKVETVSISQDHDASTERLREWNDENARAILDRGGEIYVTYGVDELRVVSEAQLDAEIKAYGNPGGYFLGDKQGTSTQSGFTITPAMAAKVTNEGLPLFSLRRALNGEHNTDDHLVPETPLYLDNPDLVDLAYANGKPIRLNVGEDGGPGRGFGAMHILGGAARDSRRAIDTFTDDEGENVVRTVLSAMARGSAFLHSQGHGRYAVRLPLANRTIILLDRGRYYSIVTVLPSAENKWGDPDWRGRLAFPLPTDATSVDPLSPTGAGSSLAGRSGIGYSSEKFKVTPDAPLVQSPGAAAPRIVVKVAQKKHRTLDAAAMAADGLAAKKSPVRANLGAMTPAQAVAANNVLGTPKTFMQRLAEFKKDWAKNLKQGIFDQFAPIAELDQQAYIQARLSKGGESTLEALMLYGKLFVGADGATDVRYTRAAGKQGFAGKMSALKGEHDRFLLWVAAQRADRLQAIGLENLWTPNDIVTLKGLDQGAMKDGTARPALYAQALQDLNEFNDNVLNVAVSSGLIDDATRQMYAGTPYVPFYRLQEDDTVTGFGIKPGLVNQYAWKKLKGGTQKLNEDLLANLLHNWSHLITASAKNRAAKATLDAAATAGIAAQVPAGMPGKGHVSYKAAGQEQVFVVSDPHLFDAVAALHYAGLGAWAKPLSAAKHWLTIGVTANPAFKLRNLIRDSIGALGSAQLSYNVAGNIQQGWQATAEDNETRAHLLASGGMIRFGSMLDGQDSQRAADLIHEGVDPAMILDSDAKIKKFWKRYVHPALSAYNEFGDRTENINRAALYEQLIAKGLTNAEAAYWSRDLMDFAMAGKWTAIRTLTQTVPFFNARLQGLYKLGRAGKQDIRRLGTVLGAVSLSSLALLLAHGDDDDWKKRSDSDRNNYWWFKVGGHAFRLPKPFEIGAVGTLAERGYELMFDKEMTDARFGRNMRDIVMSQLSMNPVPQLFKPMMDIYANKDSFTGRDIESMGMERLRKQDRYDEKTSEVARFLGSLGLPDVTQFVMGRWDTLSPKQIDFLARGYFSWLGTMTTTAIDYGIRPMLDRGARPDLQLKDVFFAGNFVESLPSNQSRYLTQLYDQAREIEQAYASYHNMLKVGDTEGARELREEEGALIKRYPATQQLKRAESLLNQQLQRINTSTTLSSEEKRARLDQVYARRNSLAERFQAQ